ncbi:penicillin-binding protein activator LpoB [Burkholderia cenocepacia]|nr:penicillin-binding protein activator LpoB [Burkholderia cenocepacia]
MKTNLLQRLTQGALVAALGASVAGCGGVVTPGGQNAGVTGAAAGGASAGADSQLQRCTSPLGTIAVDDGRNADWWGQFGSATKVTSIDPLLRLAVQQSNCFVITSIGNQKSDARLSRITQLQRNSGEYRAGSKQQKGQRVAADYYMEPQIVINDSPIGGIGSMIGGLIGNSAVAAVAGHLQTKASVVTLTLFDVRSAVQIAASEGSSTATNYGAALGGFGGGVGGALAGFSSTPEGKATVVAFIDGRQLDGDQLRRGAGRLRRRRGWCAGGLLVDAGRQGDGRRVHRRVQQDGRRAAQLQGAGRQGRAGPRWPAAGQLTSSGRRGAPADG